MTPQLPIMVFHEYRTLWSKDCIELTPPDWQPSHEGFRDCRTDFPGGFEHASTRSVSRRPEIRLPANPP